MELSKEEKAEMLAIFRAGNSNVRFSKSIGEVISMDRTICLYDFADIILEEGGGEDGKRT